MAVLPSVKESGGKRIGYCLDLDQFERPIGINKQRQGDNASTMLIHNKIIYAVGRGSVAGRYKTHFEWNAAVYADRIYTDASGATYDLSHTNTQTYSFKLSYRENGKRKKATIDIEVRFDPHCFTREKKDDTEVTLVIDQFNDGSTTERVFDLQRYQDSVYLASIIPHLSNKDCRESLQDGKVLYFKRKDGQGRDYGLYAILKLRKQKDKLVMFIETAHTRTNQPYKMKLKPMAETFAIILGRMVSTKWPELMK